MKKQWLKLWAAVLITLLLVPAYREMDDGGSREWISVLYRITRHRTMTQQENIRGYRIGTQVEILGVEVYSDVRFVSGE